MPVIRSSFGTLRYSRLMLISSVERGLGRDKIAGDKKTTIDFPFNLKKTPVSPAW